MGSVAKRIADKAEAERCKPGQDDLIEMAGDFVAAVTIANDMPVDFDGVSLSILREPGTGRLLAVVLSPVDMHADEPYPRMQINPDAVSVVKPRKLIVPA